MFPRFSRQILATAALVAFTVAPTIYVASTAWRVRRPAHLREVEAEVGRALGLRVRLGSVRYPRPGETVLRGLVVVRDEPGGLEVGRAAEVRLRRSDRELTIEADGLTLRGETAGQALARLGGLLRRSPAEPPFERVSFSAAACALDFGPGAACAVRDLVGQFLSDPSAPSLRASCRAAAGTRCEFALTRDRQGEPARTVVTFKTMEGPPLPASALDPFFDAAEWLGPGAAVEGALTLRQDEADGWEAEFQGDFFEIDLAAVVGRRFPRHSLRGKGRLGVASARWSDRPGQGYGWSEVRAELTAGPGAIGDDLLAALTRELHFRPPARPARLADPAPEGGVPFRALGLKFALTGDGQIQVEGALGAETDDGAVLLGPTAPLAYAPEGAANVRGLIKALVPVAASESGVLVPLTERSRLLLALPVPPERAAARPIGGN